LTSRDSLGVVVQVEFESNIRKQLIIYTFQALTSKHFQCGFGRFNLHRRISG
jgi:hypothetical protein